MSLGLRAIASMALAAGVVGWGLALARGPNMDLPSVAPGAGGFRPWDMFTDPRGGRTAPRRAKGAAFGYGKAVCVRLCDGYFFPASSLSGGEAACAARCPDAPTALYTMPGDRIEDAVSSTGQSYSALPVAKRYQTTLDATCACHRASVASDAMRELMADTTLRRGDVVMTRDGFRVYQGGGYGPSGPQDFVALSSAKLPASERAALAGMERSAAGSPRLSAPARMVALPVGQVSYAAGRPPQ